MRVCPLASGSKGNCTFIESKNKRILIDAGLSGKMTAERLEEIEIPIDTIDGVFITHEHSDHIGGAGVLSRKFGVPVYIHPKTYKAKSKIFRGTEEIRYFESTIELGDMIIDPIELSHDAAHPVAFKVSSENQHVGVVTDLGIATQLVRFKMQNCNVLILEMNHDIKMLQRSTKYPWEVKQRILSNYGHLSNEAGAELFNELVTPNTSHVFLAHLSEENNNPNLAMEVLLEMNRKNELLKNIKVDIARQTIVSELISF
jgi:phosphoribosyl 1,2-cyclic phosphodiesterase